MTARLALLKSLGMVVGAALLLFGCGQAGDDSVAIDDPSVMDDLHLALPALTPTDWVETYSPERASNGYTLVLYRRRLPMLIDMSGRIVHAWPHVRAVGRARLDREGHLLVIGVDDLIKEYDWAGKLLWHYRLEDPDDLPHHDLIRTTRGTVLVLTQDVDGRTDELLEVDRSGRVIWRWRAADHLASPDYDWGFDHPDPSHINSVQELPPNRWFDAGDERFRPGNILLSARNLNTVLVIDRSSGEVVWTHRRNLDRQHEAVMIPKGRLGDGLILLFNNGLLNLSVYRRSSVLAIDPVAGRSRWAYRANYFFSSTAGMQQSLPNGNLLIASSQGGRVFEITPDREIVWQWTPPFLPMRPERYPYDHCPQLAGLERRAEEAIPSRRGRPYVDRELHTFAVPGEFVERRIDGITRQIVDPDLECRELVIPPRAMLALSFGMDSAKVDLGEMRASYAFTLKLRGEEPKLLHQEVVELGSESHWRQQRIRLPGLAYRYAELCQQVETEGTINWQRAQRIAMVENPRIHSGDHPRLPPSARTHELSRQERKLRERQLKALGYIQ